MRAPGSPTIVPAIDPGWTRRSTTSSVPGATSFRDANGPPPVPASSVNGPSPTAVSRKRPSVPVRAIGTVEVQPQTGPSRTIASGTGAPLASTTVPEIGRIERLTVIVIGPT